MANTGENDALIGQTIASQFTIIRQLGAGGMGTVYLAEQVGMDRKVVVKVMHPELTAGSPTAAERFKREARAVAQLNHPNIVQIHVFGQADTGQMYIAMEYIDGRDLTRELEHGGMPEARALKIMDQTCSALIEAHSAGIVHRDLKPDNIMLTDRHGNPDYAKVLDFGIAKMAEQENAATLTQAGSVFGTPRYMAPEQARGEHIDARTDIYTLGIILFEMLTGVHPFPATTAVDYIVKHATEEILPPSQAVTGLVVSPRVDAIVRRCTEKDPAKRYQSVRELQKDLRLALRELSESSRGFPTVEPRDREAGSPVAAVTSTAAGMAVATTTRTGGVSPLIWALCGLLVAGGVIAGVLFALSGNKPAGGDDTAQTLLAGGHGDDEEHGVVVGEHGDGEEEEGDGVGDGEEEEGNGGEEAVETKLAAGTPIDGFPLPAGLKTITETPQAMVYESTESARDLIDFYKAKLAGKYELQDVPSGLMIKGDSPFGIVSVMKSADGVQLVLSRNALWERPADMQVEANPKEEFGIPVMDGASVSFKMAQAAGYRVRKPLGEVCDWYRERLGSREGVIHSADVEAETPYCSFASSDQSTPWAAVSILNDPTAAGAVLVTMAARP